MSKQKVFLLLLTVISLAGLSLGIQASRTEENITISEAVNEDLYLAAESIYLNGEVSGDVVAAGQRIIAENHISEDFIAAAEQITLRGSVGDDVRVAGRLVTISAHTAGDVLAAGETVALTRGVRIGGRAWLAGRNIDVSSDIDGELRAAGQRITLSGRVQGNVTLYAEQIEILPGARIGGNLVYHSDREASIDSRAEIAGTVQRRELDVDADREFPIVSALIWWVLSLLFSMGVICWLVPGVMRRGSEIVQQSPFKALAVGLGCFLLTPLVVLLLMVIVVGIPLALMLLATYVVALIVGFLLGIFVLSDALLRLLRKDGDVGFGLRAVGIVLAVVLLATLKIVPLVGTVVILFLMLLGLGAVSIKTHQHYASE